MFFYLKDGDAQIDAMMASVCETGGGPVKQLTDLSIRWSDYPETAARAAESVATAKRPPRNRRHRATKTLIYRLQYNRFRQIFEHHPGAVAVAWNGLTGTRRAYLAAARDAGIGIIAMERAPLPGRVTVDPVGVNQVNMLARDPDFYRSWASEQTSQREAGWRELKSKLVARAASKRSDVAQSAADSTLAETPFIFCPLQVPDDTQIKLFGGWVRTMDRFLMLLEFAASQLPEGWHLRVKEHPSSKIKLTSILEAAQAQLPGKIIIDNTTDTFAQVDASRLVLTLNSSVGLQAFWYDKPVAVLGEAFFRMPGLVTEVDGVSDLLRLFQNPDQASFDPDLRAAFMNYLDQVYYPEMEGDGAATRLRPEKVLPKIDLARASITKPT